MKISRKLRTYIGASIAAGTLLLAGVASAGTHVGASVSVSGTRAAVVTSGGEHVCTYEQRPVTRRYTDSSGGSYEHRTYETVRLCTHVAEKVYKEKRPKARKVRRKTRHTNYTIGVGYYGGSPSLHGGIHYGTSTYYRPYYSNHAYYEPYPRHHYSNRHSHRYGHRYGHHYPRSSFSLSLGFVGLHHGH